MARGDRGGLALDIIQENCRLAKHMTGSSTLIRSAVEADVDRLAAIWHQGWHDAHSHLFPQLACERTLPKLEERLRAALGTVSVADAVGQPVGFCMVKGDELYQLYVAPDARGTGVAAALVADAESRISDGGAEVAWLACAIGNDRAARFYEKCGWRRVDTVRYFSETSTGAVPVDVWRYEKGVSRSR